MAILSMGEP